jgi:carbamoyltransferase
MVVDGVGGYRCDATETLPEGDDAPPLARESESYYRFAGNEVEAIRKVWMGPSKGLLSEEFFTMPGLGALYSRVSTYIFGDWNKCGEVMGLAPYGKATAEPLAWLEEGELKVPDWDERRYRPFASGGSDAVWEKSPHREEWADLAWRVQEDTERVLIQRARWLHEQTGSRNLCIAGGVGLNCVANGKIAAQTPFENVFIQPAAGDDGIAIGCAYYGHLALAKGKRTFVMRHAYLGREYDRFDLEEALRPAEVRVFTRASRRIDIARETARLLADGSVVGWFQGRGEFGPRALGNRSILADPRDAAMKDRVNARVKHRQSFRPFAPVVLRERAADYFEGCVDSPFMLLALRVKPEARDRIPAVVHVDGTARVQTIEKEQNPLLYRLLKEFEERTGEAVLLNTSFNLRGEPIVEAPLDAMDTFLRTHLDALVIHDHLITKRAAHRMMFPVARLFAHVRRQMRYESILEGMARSVLRG